MKSINSLTVLIAIFIGLEFDCFSQNSSNAHPTVINIPKISAYSTIKLSDINVEDIQYIPLETNQNSLFSDVYYPLAKLKSIDDDIYVSDGSRILRFNSEGKFICQIGSRGRGPSEYLNCQDFYADKKADKVFVLSQWEDIIYIYSLQGKFIKSIKCPASVTNILCYNQTLLCHSNNMEGNIQNTFDIIDYEGKILKSFPNKYQYKRGKIMTAFIQECFFYRTNNQLHLKEMHDDTIFIYDELQFKPELILNRGKRKFPTSARIVNHEGESKKLQAPYIVEFNLFEIGKYIFSEFMYNNHTANYLLSKESTQTFFKVFKDGIINDFDGGPNIFLKTQKDETSAFAWINAIELKQYIESAAFKNSKPKYPEKKKQLEQLVKNLDESDNPVLILVKLKK